MPIRTALFLTLLACLAGASHAEERIAGPFEAEVLRVRDGDTIEVRAHVWLGLDLTVGVRIRGIDTPELRSACRYEKIIAAAAMDVLRQATVSGKVHLHSIEADKYAGRVVADVTTDTGTDLAAVMMASGLARPYDGGARPAWCGLAKADG